MPIFKIVYDAMWKNASATARLDELEAFASKWSGTPQHVLDKLFEGSQWK